MSRGIRKSDHKLKIKERVHIVFPQSRQRTAWKIGKTATAVY